MNTIEAYPEIVYKYRNWRDSFQKDVLKNNQLFLSSPNYFNDPFDVRIHKSYLSLNSPEKIKKYADAFIGRQKQNIIDMGLNIIEEHKKLVYDLTNNIQEFQESNEKIASKQQDIHYGILSLTTRWDSILMWSHYGDHHKGVCYGFWEKKLRESRLFDKGGLVSYPKNNEYPIIDPLEENPIRLGFAATHTKSSEWKYENEYRLFKLLFPKAPTDKDRIKLIPDNFFAEIILGISISKDHKNEILKLAKMKGIKVFQAKKVSQKFEITREEIL